MPRCLDQKTTFERKDFPNDFPILSSRVVMEEYGEIRVYTLRTATTTDHPERWKQTKEPAEGEEAARHYATTLRHGEDITMEHHYIFNVYNKSHKLTFEDTLHAVESHINRVNDLRTCGSGDTRRFMSPID